MLETHQTNDDYKKTSIALLYITLIIWVFVTIIVYFDIFQKLYNNAYVNNIYLRINLITKNTALLKIVAIILLSTAIITYTPLQRITVEKRKRAVNIGLICLAIYLMLAFVDTFYYTGFFSLALHLIVSIVGIFYFLESRKKLEEDLKKDRRNTIESEFDQYREVQENEYSINIPYSYEYKNEEYISHINIINPFRGTLIGGTPGSGKSFAIIEEFMRQQIRKFYTGVVYDFKFPTLSKKTYNYLNWYADLYPIPPKFYYINFDNPEYSHRCNPINADMIRTIADADEATKVLMLNINKTWIEKEGDFFTDSANVYTSMLLWYLKILTEKYQYDICSFPHLVALSTFESQEILFLLLNKYNDLKPKMTPFQFALSSGALEQLAGQVSSAGIALSKVNNDKINFILSGSDFTFDLNNKLSPKILCVGNNPENIETYSPTLGLLFSRLAQTLNKQGRLHSFYHVDEFPTIYIRGIDSLIATGRSNKIAVLLGFQSFAQIVADYSKNVADKIIRICGNRIMGQLMDEDAETISKGFGKQKVQTKSFTFSSSDISQQDSISMEEIVPASTIAQFSQGVFAGIMADNFGQEEISKVFYGKVEAPLDLKKHEDELELPKVYDFSPSDLNERIEEYQKTNKIGLEVLKKILSENTFDIFQELKDQNNQTINFNNSFIEYFGLYDVPHIKRIIIDINLSLRFLPKIESIYYKELNFGKTPKLKDLKYSESEAIEFINEAIKASIIEKNTDMMLKKNTAELYQDIYRIIAIEIEKHNLIDELVDNANLKKKSKIFFKKILNSDNIKEKEIKELYQNYLEQVEI